MKKYSMALLIIMTVTIFSGCAKPVLVPISINIERMSQDEARRIFITNFVEALYEEKSVTIVGKVVSGSHYEFYVNDIYSNQYRFTGFKGTKNENIMVFLFEPVNKNLANNIAMVFHFKGKPILIADQIADPNMPYFYRDLGRVHASYRLRLLNTTFCIGWTRTEPEFYEDRVEVNWRQSDYSSAHYVMCDGVYRGDDDYGLPGASFAFIDKSKMVKMASLFVSAFPMIEYQSRTNGLIRLK